MLTCAFTGVPDLEKRDYYETLGVSRDADTAELKAYRGSCQKISPRP